MSTRAGIVVALLAASEGWSHALRVEAVFKGNGSPAAAEVAIDIRSTAPGIAPCHTVVKGDAPAEIEAPGKGPWLVQASAFGYWADRIVVPADANGVQVALWPTGTVEGTVLHPGGEPTPKGLSVRFLAAAATDPRSAPSGSIDCAAAGDDGRFACSVPAGRWNLRLRFSGFASRFLWDVTVPPGGACEAGRWALRRGASVVGEVVGERSGSAVEGATIRLTPTLGGPSGGPAVDGRAGELALTATTDARGRFAFLGVPAGSYVLTGRKGELAAAPRFLIPVAEGAETEIDRPLVLAEALDLTVEVEPKVDPGGRPWVLDLSVKGQGLQSYEPVESATLPELGIWVRRGLAAGDYALRLSDEGGSRWAWKEFSLSPSATAVAFQVPAVPVRGTVRLGKNPIPAALAFGGATGTIRVTFHADEDGTFSGYLPREGHWKVVVAVRGMRLFREIGKVEVRRRPEEREAVLDIDLPDTAVHVQVVDERREPVGHAKINVDDLVRRESLFGIPADRSGRFVFRGVGPGPVRFEATSGDLSSEAVTFDIEESAAAPQELQLVVSERLRLEGTVRSPAGPVFGAQISQLAAGEILSRPAITGVDGKFTLRFPPRTSAARLVVMSPGFALRAFAVRLGPAEPIEVAVDQFGGRLVVVLPAVLEDLLESRQLLIFHAGGVLWPAILDTWKSISGAAEWEPNTIVVENAEAGDYVACLVPHALALSAAEGTWSPPTMACGRAVLPPLGEAVLRIPAVSKPQQ
jgi:hypothetical protein